MLVDLQRYDEVQKLSFVKLKCVALQGVYSCATFEWLLVTLFRGLDHLRKEGITCTFNMFPELFGRLDG